jgi:HK97 family phage portal protein
MILNKLIQRRSINDPSIPITDPRVWAKYFGSNASDSGVSVTVNSLLSYSPIWAGVRMISQDVAQMPLYVYRRANGGKERATEHAAYRLLRRQANEDMTASMWKQVVVTHALLYGVSYTLIDRTGGAEPDQLLPVSPDRVRSFRDHQTGALRYEVGFADRPDLQNPVRVPAGDMIVILGLTLDGLGGLSLIEYARNSIGRGLAAEKYSNKYFRNNARPGGILVHPNKLDDVALNNLRDSFSQLQEGLDNAHRFAILEEGMQWIQTGVDPEKSQLIQSLEFGVKDASRVLGIPPHRLGDDSKTSFASLEQENLSYQQSSLGPWYSKIQEESYAKLLSPDERKADSHTVEFERNAILQADAKTRHDVYAVGLNWGFYNRNEVRAWENMNPLPDGAGEEFYMPLNMAIAGEEPEPVAEPVAPAETLPVAPDDEPVEDDERHVDPAVVSALSRLMNDAAARAGRRMSHYFQRASASGKYFCLEIDRMDRHIEVVGSMFEPVVAAIDATGLPCPSAVDLATRYVQMWGRAMDGLSKTCDEEKLAGAVDEVIESLLDSGVKVLPEG